MKPTNFLTFYKFNSQSLCSKKSFTRYYLWLRSLLSFLPVIRGRVRPAIQRGSVAFRELVANTRHLSGALFIVVGCLSSVSYHIFNPLVIDKSWYYLNWFYFLYTIREELLIGFWAVGTFLLLPQKYTLSFVPCAFALGWSVASILNYWFFVHSNESFHQDVMLSVWIAGLSLALGFIICTDYLVHRWNHYRRGNHQRFTGIVRMKDTSQELKWQLLEKNCEEYDRLNQKI